MIFVGLAFTLNQTVNAKQAELIEGIYSQPGQTFVIGYETQISCEGDNGNWDFESGMCLFDVEDSVQVQGSKSSLSVVVETVGSNAHSCQFESETAERLPTGEVLAKAPGSSWDGDEWKDGICEVRVSPLKNNSVSVSSNSFCREYCGARAVLQIEKATRQ